MPGKSALGVIEHTLLEPSALRRQRRQVTTALAVDDCHLVFQIPVEKQ
jgi:hypothetical protein